MRARTHTLARPHISEFKLNINPWRNFIIDTKPRALWVHTPPPSVPIERTHTRTHSHSLTHMGVLRVQYGILHIHVGISRYVIRKLMFIAYIRMKKKCCSVFICSHSTRARAHAHIHKYSIENVVVVVVVVIAVAAKVAPGTPFTIYETHFKKYIPKRVQQKKTHRPFSNSRLGQGWVDTQPEQISHKLKMTLHTHTHRHSKVRNDNFPCICSFARTHYLKYVYTCVGGGGARWGLAENFRDGRASRGRTANEFH